MNTTEIAWALMRKWAAHYGVKTKALKKDHFRWATKLAQSYSKAAPAVIERQIGEFL